MDDFEQDINEMDLAELDALSAELEAQRKELRQQLKLVNERRTALNIEREQAARSPDTSLDQRVGLRPGRDSE